MIEMLKEMILDNQEKELKTGVIRDLEISRLEGKATICIGVRRCGKSTYGYQLMEKLMKSGVKRENILYINFFDNRLHNLDSESLSKVTEAYFSIYPENKTEKIYCFFDEIQEVDGWESYVERILRTENCEVFITGSSAKMLSKEIATQMRGRALSWELFPFSFKEFLSFKGLEVKKNYTTKERLMIQNAFSEYWESGGFPEVAGLKKDLRIKIHQEYFNAILFRDVVERYDISHPKALTDLAQWLIDNNSSLYSINKLTGYLKSLGYSVPKSSVSDYMEYFEDAFFLFTLKKYDSSLARKNMNPKKIYCVDHSFAASVSSGVLVNTGHLLENLVFTSLRRKTSDLHYYKTQTGKEVDFIAKVDRSELSLVQVSHSLADPQTRKRELTSLGEAMKEMNLDHGTVVTTSEEETIDVESGTISVVPVWRFMLN